MSWNDPTQSEAMEEYSRSRNKYRETSDKKQAADKRLTQATERKNTVTAAVSRCRSEKRTMEETIAELDRIIKQLDGTSAGGVPEVIDEANAAAKRAEESFKSSILCEDVKSADIEGAFTLKSVEEHKDSLEALEALKREKYRLETAAEELGRQMDTLSAELTGLNGTISAASAEQADLKRELDSAAFEMSHYKKYI